MIGYEHGLRHIEVRLDQYTLLMFKHTAAPEKGVASDLGAKSRNSKRRFGGNPVNP